MSSTMPNATFRFNGLTLDVQDMIFDLALFPDGLRRWMKMQRLPPSAPQLALHQAAPNAANATPDFQLALVFANACPLLLVNREWLARGLIKLFHDTVVIFTSVNDIREWCRSRPGQNINLRTELRHCMLDVSKIRQDHSDFRSGQGPIPITMLLRITARAFQNLETLIVWFSRNQTFIPIIESAVSMEQFPKLKSFEAARWDSLPHSGMWRPGSRKADSPRCGS